MGMEKSLLFVTKYCAWGGILTDLKDPVELRMTLPWVSAMLELLTLASIDPEISHCILPECGLLYFVFVCLCAFSCCLLCVVLIVFVLKL